VPEAGVGNAVTASAALQLSRRVVPTALISNCGTAPRAEHAPFPPTVLDFLADNPNPDWFDVTYLHHVGGSIFDSPLDTDIVYAEASVGRPALPTDSTTLARDPT
jgi:hypothetical protein